MARKVFLSILGTGPYSECTYSVEKQDIMSTRYIQLATIKHLIQKGIANNEEWTKDDAVIIFVTQKSEEQQWLKGLSRENGSTVEREGLKALAEKEGFPMPVVPVRIKDGNNEEEIWEVFNVIFDKIEEDDELYLDTTHAFRYLPMLLLVLIDYAKFLKNVKVKSFMVEDSSKPIMDLTPILRLQDWTFAAGQYIENGSVDRLVSLCEQEFKPILKESKGSNEVAQNLRVFSQKLLAVTEERQTCRGLDIIKSTSFKGLKQSADKLESTFIDAFNPIFEKIKSSLVSFDENENIRNGLSAANWCYKNGLYQQSATILQEFVVSFLCLRHGIAIDDEVNREIINKAFNIKYHNTRKEGWIIEPEKVDKLEEVLLDDLFEDKNLINNFNNLTEVRNDFNHSGMRLKRPPLKPQNIKENIRKCILEFALILFNIKAEL